ncbi:hypothetical protein [Serratia liquefaciens]|uniref:hypothetical protein n=1 Tax=Serratia liquefaciens TaxID=614 RepID=UPI0039C6AE12
MDKFSELKDALEFLETTEFDGEWDSALVGGDNGENYHAVINANDVVVRASDDSRHTSWLCDYLEAVSPVNIRALLAELEAKDKALNNVTELWKDANATAFERIRELRAKLATPVRFPDCDIEAVSITAHWLSDEEVNAWVKGIEFAKQQVRAAGFTVEGDE